MARRASLVDPRRPVPGAAKPAGKAAAVSAPEPQRSPSRAGKRGVTLWLDAAAHRQLRQLALDTDTPIQGLMERAFDLLMHEHGKPGIASLPSRAVRGVT